MLDTRFSRRRLPFLVVCLLLSLPARAEDAGAFVTGGVTSPDGVRAVCDLPANQHMQNTGGSDGAGLCVFTSVEVSARWQNVPDLSGFQKWMTRKPGGGYPEKLDEMLSRFCSEKGVQKPDIVQHTGGDESFLDLAISTGRMPSITYGGKDDFYSSGIYHMVDLAHLDKNSACIVDNNRAGKWVWMTRAELLQRWRGSRIYDNRGNEVGGGWAVCLLAPPPPPYGTRPTNLVARGQCPGGQCSGGVCLPVQQVPRWIPDQNGNLCLWDGIQVVETKKVEEKKPDNFGLLNQKLHGAKRWFVNGKEVEKSEAHAALSLVDDSERYNVSAVGDADFLSRVKSAVDQLPASDREKFHVQLYKPDSWDSWAVSQFKLSLGVTIRKPSKDRVGAEVGHLDTSATRESITQHLVDVLHPPAPMPPAPAPTPTPAPTPAIPSGLGWLAVLLLVLIARRK